MTRPARRFAPAAALAPALVLVGLAGLAGLACARSGGKPRAADLGPTRVVSQETANGATPMFVATPRGDRIVAWVSAPDGGEDGRLHLAVTPAGADAPLPTATVRDPLGPIEAHGEAPPQIAGDSAGGIYALYTVGRVVPGRRFPVSALRFVRSMDGGRTWSAPITVNDAAAEGGAGSDFGSHNFHALTVGPAGTVIATWLDGRSGRTGVWMSRSTDGGQSWEPNRAVYADSTCPCCRTGVAVGPKGEMYVAWRAVLPGDVRDVVVMRSDDGGATWSEPVRPRADGWVYPGCPHAGPSLRVDGEGAVHIAWWTGKAGVAGVSYARSTDGGRTWEAQPLGVAKTSRPAHVQLALAGRGRVVAAWDDGVDTVPRILLRRSSDGGRSFAPTELVSEPGAAASFPVLLVHGDSLAVGWSQVPLAEHRHEAAMAAQRDPKAAMGLPRVGQSEIYVREGRL